MKIAIGTGCLLAALALAVGAWGADPPPDNIGYSCYQWIDRCGGGSRCIPVVHVFYTNRRRECDPGRTGVTRINTSRCGIRMRFGIPFPCGLATSTTLCDGLPHQHGCNNCIVDALGQPLETTDSDWPLGGDL